MSGMAFKSILNEFCQKRRVALPVYSTKLIQTPQGLSSYACTVELFDGNSFESQGTFSNKKSAEQNAAQHALIALQQPLGQQTPISDTAETCGSTPEGIPYDDASSLNKNSLVTSKYAVTIASSPGRVTMLPVQTVGQPKQMTLPTFATAKNMLNERAQKLHICLPSYQTAADTHGGGFLSKVTFNGMTYCSNGGFRLKKEAEKSAALEALKVLLQQGDMQVGGNNASVVIESNRQEFCNLEGNKKNAVANIAHRTQKNNISGIISKTTDNQDAQTTIQNFSPDVPGASSTGLPTLVEMPTTPTGAQIASEGVSQPSPVSFKNLLQEYMQQRGITGPKYETCMTDFGFFKSTVHFCGKMIEATQASSTKKQAEQLAARHALLDLGIEEPEKLVSSKKAKDRTRKLGSLKRKHFQGSGDLDFLCESPSNLDPRLRKRQRVDQSFFAPKTLKLQSPLMEKILGPIDFLSVGELWKEKKNVAVIGNDKTSFVLHCTRFDGSLQMLNTRSMENVELKQGYRIIGLDADLVQRQGQLILQSERCADIVIPETPDPVLISCGAVVLHLDPDDSSNTEVLLKRYTHSPAFINVKAALAQFFRRSVSGHPLPLPVASLTEHIQQWALEEVGYIAAMDIPAMQQVFLNFWKFKDSWCSILEPDLPNDLRDLQTRAQEELSRRIFCGANANDASSYPWGLPKGNFRHRMLSTGLHIEKPSECAARELREETGIHINPSDLEKFSYVDVPQDDNLNPHEGDIARYFLYVYNPIIEELNSSTSDIIMSNTQSKSQLLQSDNVSGCENESKDEEEIERKHEKVKCEENKDSDDGQTTSVKSYQKSKEENLESASLTEKKTNSSSREAEEMPSVTKEANTEVCSALPSPSSSSSSSSPASSLEMKKKDLPENLTILAEVEVDKDSSSRPIAKDPCIIPFDYFMSSSSSSAAAAASSSSPQKTTPLNTNFKTEDDSSENCNSSLKKKSDPLHPTMPCKSISSNKDPEIRDNSKFQEDSKMIDSVKDSNLSAKEKIEDVPSDVQHISTESCSYQVKRGLKRKRGSSEDEESGNEDDDGTQQEPGTSTPVADTHTSRYQSPMVQGAKHEECSWFSIDEAVKISPLFATIYKTEKFLELLMLLKKTWI